MEMTISKPAAGLAQTIEREKQRLLAEYEKQGLAEDGALGLAITAVCRARGLTPSQLKRKLNGNTRTKRPRKPAPRGRAKLVAAQKKGRA